MSCFGAPILNCGSTPYVCPACASTCRGAMLFQIISPKILSMQPENSIWTQVLVARFGERSSSFFGLSPSTSSKSLSLTIYLLYPDKKVISDFSVQGLSQNLKTGCPELAVVRLLGVLLQGRPQYTLIASLL